MKTLNYQQEYCTPFQLILPLNLETLLDFSDPVVTFNNVMHSLDWSDILSSLNWSNKGRIGYDNFKLLKAVLFGFMLKGSVSLRELADLCKNDIRFMWLMQNGRPSHTTFANFINNFLDGDAIDVVFSKINNFIFEKDNVDLNHLYLDGSKFEANANKYSWVWKKSCIKNRDKTFAKVSCLIDEINARFLVSDAVKIQTREVYEINFLDDLLVKLQKHFSIDVSSFKHGKGSRKSFTQRLYEQLLSYTNTLKRYAKGIEIAGELRNSYSKTDNSATFMRVKKDYMGNDQLLPAYNVQLGICDQYIAVADLYQYASDSDCFAPIMHKFNNLYGHFPEYPVADAGYGSFNNYIFCEQHGMKKYMKFSMFNKTVKDKKYSSNPYRVNNFNIKDGTMYCPNNKPFKFIYNSAIKGNKYGREYEVYECESCEGCTLKSNCTNSKNNRRVQLNKEMNSYYAEALDNLNSIQGALLRQNRSIQAEGTFGVIKYDRWYKRLVRRGERTKTELLLVCIGFNLYKYHNKKYNQQD